VKEEGNLRAMEIMHQVFTPRDANWRGLGLVSGSGLQLREEFSRFDGGGRLGLEITEVPDPKGCACGEVLRSIIAPSDCRLFGTACTPEHPVGPCMVSSEGSCGAHYRYRQI
jgi:hydrogenase expression/formation protein HypD